MARELGEPWDRGTSVGADGRPYLYAYGCLELGTCQEHCQEIRSVIVQTDWPTMEWPAREQGRVERFSGFPAYSDVVRALGEAGCVWEEHEPLTFDDQLAIRVPASGAEFVFAMDEGAERGEGGEPRLCSVSVAGHRPHACG
ncbi:hypothetical protein CP973_20895 [Streptomyces albofaciens JCM 4342]|nr:hypothetical protein CP973_20895 [Streptomyces albofaciens JCM 4342]